MMNALELHNVSKTFRAGKNEVVALDGLNLDMQQGKILALLGPNGSGKTTTVRVSCGLLAPDSGQVKVLGKDITKYKSQVLKDIGVLLEPGKGIFQNRTVMENIEYWGLLKGIQDRGQLESKGNELTEFFDLEDKRSTLANALSTGMRQKLSLCCTLVTDPKIILLDEPNVGMDVEASLDLVNRLRWLAREKGCAILVTSHQMDFMEDLCDEAAFISNGRVILRGSIEEVRWMFQRQNYKFTFRRPESDDFDPYARLSGIQSFKTDLPNNMAELIVDSNSTSMNELMKFALDESLEVVALEVVRPSLKECYQMLFAEGVVTNDNH